MSLTASLDLSRFHCSKEHRTQDSHSCTHIAHPPKIQVCSPILFYFSLKRTSNCYFRQKQQWLLPFISAPYLAVGERKLQRSSVHCAATPSVCSELSVVQNRYQDTHSLVQDWYQDTHSLVQDWYQDTHSLVQDWYQDTHSLVQDWYQDTHSLVQDWYQDTHSLVQDWYQDTHSLVQDWYQDTHSLVQDWYQDTHSLVQDWYQDTHSLVQDWYQDIQSLVHQNDAARNMQIDFVHLSWYCKLYVVMHQMNTPYMYTVHTHTHTYICTHTYVHIHICSHRHQEDHGCPVLKGAMESPSLITPAPKKLEEGKANGWMPTVVCTGRL